MYKLYKQARAKQDLKDIWLYTFKTWGEVQADRYFDDLDNGLKTLSHNPDIGKNRDSIREGYRSFQINRHVFFYKVSSSTIRIVRVLQVYVLLSIRCYLPLFNSGVKIALS